MVLVFVMHCVFTTFRATGLVSAALNPSRRCPCGVYAPPLRCSVAEPGAHGRAGEWMLGAPRCAAPAAGTPVRAGVWVRVPPTRTACTAGDGALVSPAAVALPPPRRIPAVWWGGEGGSRGERREEAASERGRNQVSKRTLGVGAVSFEEARLGYGIMQIGEE